MSKSDMKTENNDLESRIIDAARCLFIEKGYAETSMSDIAARVGINRSGLHYYFRTKDRMFQAVFGEIVQSMVPAIEGVIYQKDISVARRIESIVDAYYSMLLKNPSLPLFVVREIDRDSDYLMKTLTGSVIRSYIGKLVEYLRAEMAEGNIRTVPMHVVFYTFYGLLTFPFLTRKLSTRMVEDGSTFNDILQNWKPYIIFHMENLLRPE